MEDLLRKSGRLTAARLTGAALALGVMTALAGCVPDRPAPLGSAEVLPSWAGHLRTFTEQLDENQVHEMTANEWAAVARANSIIVLNSWDFRLIPVLKRANPQVKVWLYKDLSGIRSDDCTASRGRCGNCGPGISDSNLLSSGMGYCWTIRHHADWLLRSARTGRPFQFRNYPRIWATDYGNSSYQGVWVHNVLADVRAHGWDGVAVDNALTTADAYGVAARYRNDSSVQDATYSALVRIGKAFRYAGVPSVVNVGYATRFPGLWERWLWPVGGLEQEFYLARPAGHAATGAAWGKYEREVSSCAAQHKSCWFKPVDGARSGASSYALGSYLIAASGQQLFGARNIASPSPRCWQLGAADGRAARLGPGWRRFFRHGIAIVNPTSERLTVPAGGAYLDRHGHAVAEVTLQPASAAVLQAAPPRFAQPGLAQPGLAHPGRALC